MRHRQPLHKRPKIAVIFRPEHKMPVIGHEAIAHNSHRPLFQRFDNHTLEGKVIVVVKNKDCLPTPRLMT